MPNFLDKHNKNRKLVSLIENRTIYTARNTELSIFETYQTTFDIELSFNNPSIVSMLTGRKVMRIDDSPSFDFLPGESLVLPSDKKLSIDFPEASLENPTQCIVLTIDPVKINQIVQMFNDQVSIENDTFNLDLTHNSSHLTNQREINILLQRLVNTFTDDQKFKDAILDVMVQELIIRLLQTQAREILLTNENNQFSDTRIGAAVKYIKDHLTEKNISVETLARVACMSTSHFYKQFKNTLGISPIDYINSERIKLSKQLFANSDGNIKISDVAFLSGFNSVSYFNRQFKKYELMSPTTYLKALKNTHKKFKR